MYCSNCGYEPATQSEFCPSCGMPMTQAPQPQAQPVSPTPVQQPVSPLANRQKKKQEVSPEDAPDSKWNALGFLLGLAPLFYYGLRVLFFTVSVRLSFNSSLSGLFLLAGIGLYLLMRGRYPKRAEGFIKFFILGAFISFAGRTVLSILVLLRNGFSHDIPLRRWFSLF